MDEYENDAWRAQVQGREVYDVEVVFGKKGLIKKATCDCPFEAGFCKHVVAVIYAVQHEKSSSTSVGKNKRRETSVRDLLEKVSLKELRQFIETHTAKDKDFRTVFFLHFADKDDHPDSARNYEKLIKQCILKHSYRGYLDYRAANALSRDIDGFLDKAQQLTVYENYQQAYLLLTVIIKQTMATLTEADDSDGVIGDSIDSAILTLADVGNSVNAANELKERMFGFLQNEMNKDIYFDYGNFGYNMFSVYKMLALQLGKSDTFLSFPDKKLADLKGNLSEYDQKFYALEKMDFLKSSGKHSEAEKLACDNMEMVEVRMDMVGKMIDQKDFENIGTGYCC